MTDIFPEYVYVKKLITAAVGMAAATAGVGSASAANAATTTTPTPTPSTTATTPTVSVRYTSTQRYTYAFTNRPGAGGTYVRRLAPNLAVTGQYFSDGWMKLTSGPNTGLWIYYTNSTNPYNAYETRQWNNIDGFQAMAPTSVTVTRYTLSNRTNTPVRSAPSYATTTKVSSLAARTALTGHYVNSHWFQITSGANAGRYVSSGALFTTSSQSLVNGKLKSGDLCSVPDAMRLVKDFHDSSMGCEALQQLIKVDASMYANDRVHVREWEAYRTYATQQYYYRLYGSPQAAVPGTSNHGLGNALDLRQSTTTRLTWSSLIVTSMTKRGASNGWIKPSYLKPSGSYYGEPWHFEFNG